MVKAVISGYYGYKNFGDEAVLSVLMEHLNSLNIEPTILSGDVEYTKSLYNSNVINRFDISKVINAIKNSDILISGGGSLLQDATSLKSLVYYLFIIAVAILFNKKVIIFAQGIGPINNKIGKIFTRNLLKQCSYLSVRDEASYKLMTEWGIKADLVCDPVFDIKVVQQNSKDKIGVQLRNFKSMNLNLLQKLAQLIISKYSNKKIEIFSLQKTQDYEICKRFSNILKSLKNNLDIEIVEDDLINRLSNLEYLISMRFHSLLIGIKAGIKCCAINYDIKVEQLASVADIPIISMNADDNFEKIYEKLENLDTKKLLEYSNSKQFDWSNFDKSAISK